MPVNPFSGSLPIGVTDSVTAMLMTQGLRIAALEATVRSLQTIPTIQEVAGTPTSVARNGTPAVDTATAKLWIRRNGTWQFATLT